MHTGIDGLGEVLLLVADDAGDIRLLLAQLGILALVFVHDHIHDLMTEARMWSVMTRRDTSVL